MRIPFFSKPMTSYFDDLLQHAEKVKECGWVFQQAIECFTSGKCQAFEEYRQEVINLESEADAIKRRIRGHLPQGTKMPVSRFEFFMYIREQDKVLDSVENSLNWISYRPTLAISEQMQKHLFLLVDSVLMPIEELSRMVTEAKRYFENYSEKQRRTLKDIIHNLRKRENEVDRIEGEFKIQIFAAEKDPVGLFHMIRLAETIGSIADHAENAGDMMRIMIAKRDGIASSAV
ncbi:MAG: TIGR00153 family protein [Desulfobacterales bacterium]